MSYFLRFTVTAFIQFLLLTTSNGGGNVASASKTFVATSNPELPLRPLPEELTVDNIEDVVRRTKLFTSIYNASILTYEDTHDQNGEELKDYKSTETKPDVFLIRGSPVPSDGSIKSSPFGFVSAATTAYGHHANLVIRPDDIWITILSQFAFYVNARAEQLRYKFVSHEGQKDLVVTVFGYTVYDAPYDEMTAQFLDKISENINDPSLREWFLPGFTTTTKTDEVVAAATAMCTFQEYFTYTFSIACGIPYVTLEGSVEDWELLQSKVERLLEFDLEGEIEEWVDLLRIVMANFVESSKNGSKNNLEFWDNILYENTMGYGTPLLSGWITVFSFFGEEGQKLGQRVAEDSVFRTPDGVSEPPRRTFLTMDRDDMNPNVLSCPATVDDNGVKYNATLFVGQMSFAYEQASGEGFEMEIKPRNDWALIIQDGTVEVERPTDSYSLQLPHYPHRDVGMLIICCCCLCTFIFFPKTILPFLPSFCLSEMCYWFDHLELADDQYKFLQTTIGAPGDSSSDEPTGSSSTCRIIPQQALFMAAAFFLLLVGASVERR